MLVVDANVALRAVSSAYDAEYVALASLLGCRLVTIEGHLGRGVDRRGFIVGPLDL
jgi:predicted nucleic acid-binding protein